LRKIFVILSLESNVSVDESNNAGDLTGRGEDFDSEISKL